MNRWIKKLKLRLPALALLVVTVLFWSHYDHYEAVGSRLLESPAPTDGTSIRGDVSGNDGYFVLRVPKGGKQARIDFTLPGGADCKIIRAHARMKTDGVVIGKHSWNCARVLLAQYDANKKWISGPHGLASEGGSEGWKEYQDEFEIQPNAARVVMILQQTGAEGSAEFDQIEAWPVRIRASFIWWRIAFAASWIGMAVLYIPRCRLNHRKLRLLILLNALAILVGALMPGDWISDGSAWAKKTWAQRAQRAERSQPPPSKSVSPSPPQKLTVKKERDTQQMDRFNQMVDRAHGTGHFVLFATLCFLVYLSAALERQHSSFFFKVGFDVLLFAAVTESLQFLTIDREAGLSDLLIDVYGMATAFLLFLVVLPLVRHFLPRDGLEG